MHLVFNSPSETTNIEQLTDLEFQQIISGLEALRREYVRDLTKAIDPVPAKRTPWTPEDATWLSGMVKHVSDMIDYFEQATQ